ncbi:MAG: hypothetical protein HOF44_06680 [Pelagibacterales bacterium]|jgi:hypothetical protein|nr:hypothetical protein [Pelagibacterales bacterium]
MPSSDIHHCDPKLVSQVRDSYTRCQKDEKFFDTFYKNLLGKSEQIEQKFEHTDWIRQHNLIKLAIKSAILYAENPDMKLTQKKYH